MSRVLTTQTAGKQITTASQPGTAVVVAAASTVVLAANPNRIVATIVNDSVNVVYVTLGTPAAINSGIRLNASGGSLVLGLGTDIPYTGVVTAWAAAAGSNVTVTEG